MRRLALPLLAVVLLYSCATGRDQAADEETPIAEDAITVLEEPLVEEPVVVPDTTDVGQEPEIQPEPELEPEPEPQPEPEPEEPPIPSLVIVEPVDLSQLTSLEFFLAARLTTPDATDDSSQPDMALSSELPLALDFELISGPLVAGQYEVTDARDLPESARVLRIRLSDLGPSIDIESSEVPPRDILRAAAAITLPSGVVDGETYAWRARGVLRDGRLTEWTGQHLTVLNLGFPAPAAFGQLPTIDSTPIVTWPVDAEIAVYRASLVDYRGAVLGEVVTTGNSYTVPAALAPGRYTVRLSGLRVDGFSTRQGSAATFRILGDASPSAIWPVDGEATLGPKVGLHWAQVRGAVAYQSQYREQGGEWITLPVSPSTWARIPGELTAGGTYEWQVRAIDENGRLFSFNAPGSFVVDPVSLSFSPVIPAGETATLTRGYSDGSRDERPVVAVELTRPFEMATTALTNAEAARLVNYALDRELASADADGVWSESGVPLIGIGVMDYGQQLGLRVSGGRLVAVSGYEEHPAVGITWAGAVGLANLLSFVEGRTPAYDMDTGEWDNTSDGYRLPTEAEWEYAARGATTRLTPWGSGLSGRVANYYRSFDPYEDVNEPFNSAGGPTTPVSFFDGSVRDGFQTGANVSPFGIRDMVGNTWEWCWDRYDPNYYADSDTVDPSGPDASDIAVSNQAVVLAVTLDPDQRVVRGTAWNSRATDVRLTNRGRFTELGRSYSIGVRLVRAPAD